MSARPCQTCNKRPKVPGRMRCEWCILKAQSVVIQVEVMRERRRKGETGLWLMLKPKASWPEGWRWCGGCLSLVPLDYCRGSRCRACASEAGHRQHQKATFGLSAAAYDHLYALQGGVCAICGAKPRTKRLATDHNHGTGEIRGLLCQRCNNELLVAGEHKAEIFLAAAEYLTNPPTRKLAPRGN